MTGVSLLDGVPQRIAYRPRYRIDNLTTSEQSMTDATRDTYEEMPYDSRPQPCTYPSRLAAVASLYGMTPAPPDRCRVLELGCGTGGNLIPMATTLPNSTFVGIDLSPSQIAEGQGVIDELGLKNISLAAESILDVDASIGQFDYILCHGVYSWVPPDVQVAIMRICKEHLAPQGIAYISYNTYPGWRIKSLVRDMLRFHAKGEREPALRVAKSREFAGLLSAAVDGSPDVYGRLLDQQVRLLAEQPDYYLYHEHLDDANEPVYFHEFAARASEHGLQYVDEAAPTTLPSSLPPDALRAVEQMQVGLIEKEQYLDYLCGRTFRMSLLCHDEVAIRRPASAAALRKLSLLSNARPVAESLDLTSTTAEGFRSADGRTVAAEDPLIKTALALLSEAFPRAVSYECLWEQVTTSLNGTEIIAKDPAKANARLAAPLLHIFQTGLVEMHAHDPQIAVQIGSRPCASPLSRMQAVRPHKVTNLRHADVKLSDFDRQVLRQLDGTKTCDEIEQKLRRLIDMGKLAEEQEKQSKPIAATPPTVRESIDASLHRLARLALLQA